MRLTDVIIPTIIGIVLYALIKRKPHKDAPTLEARCNTEFVILMMKISDVDSYLSYLKADLDIEVFRNYWEQCVSPNLLNQCMFKLENRLQEKKYYFIAG